MLLLFEIFGSLQILNFLKCYKIYEVLFFYMTLKVFIF